jgi:hypothetical protein
LAIEVGTPIARRPPRRSRRAELPHRAPRRTRRQSATDPIGFVGCDSCRFWRLTQLLIRVSFHHTDRRHVSCLVIVGKLNKMLRCADPFSSDHGRFHARVAKQILHGADVGAALEQLGGKTVASGVGRDAFWNPAFSCQQFVRAFERLQRFWSCMSMLDYRDCPQRHAFFLVRMPWYAPNISVQHNVFHVRLEGNRLVR